IERGGMAASVACIEWAGPDLAELVVGTLRVVPDALSIGVNEFLVVRVGKRAVQVHEIAYKDAFELHAVGPAVRLAGVMQDAIGIGKVGERSRCDGLRCGDERRIWGYSVERCKAAEDYTLVVSPCVLLVILAGGEIQPVIDEMLGVDHA